VAALAHVADGVRARVGWITAEQGWAIDVALRAGLELTVHARFCIAGAPAPAAVPAERPFA